MDHRDVPLWVAEARRKRAEDQVRACEAAAYPYMTNEARSSYMEALNEQITGAKSQEASRPSAEQEAEWRKNREELLRIFGRKG